MTGQACQPRSQRFSPERPPGPLELATLATGNTSTMATFPPAPQAPAAGFGSGTGPRPRGSQGTPRTRAVLSAATERGPPRLARGRRAWQRPGRARLRPGRAPEMRQERASPAPCMRTRKPIKSRSGGEKRSHVEGKKHHAVPDLHVFLVEDERGVDERGELGAEFVQ